MAERPLIKESLLMLNVCGANPTQKNVWSKIRASTTIALLLHMIVEFLLQLAFNWQGWHSVEVFMLFASFSQIQFKAMSLILNKRKFLNILQIIGSFWSRDDLDVQSQNTTKDVSEIGTKLIKTFFIIGTFLTGYYLVAPSLVDAKMLPFNTYHPINLNSSLGYWFMYFMQTTEATATYFCTLGFDCLFISFVIHAVSELKFIKHRFAVVDVMDKESCLKEVGVLVDHHNLVLRCIKDLDAAYSATLLTQFSSSVIFICTGLLAMVASGFPLDLMLVLKLTAYLTCVLLQLFFYCGGGNYLITESQSVSEAIYDSDWWAKTQPKFRRACVLMIQRANKVESLTAGGMFIVNLESFAKVVRFGLSVYSLAQALGTQSQ